MTNPNKTYAGYNHDKHGITTMGRVVLDAWVFGFLPETEDCAGWDLGRMQVLMEKVETEWDKFSTHSGSRLSEDADGHFDNRTPHARIIRDLPAFTALRNSAAAIKNGCDAAAPYVSICQESGRPRIGLLDTCIGRNRNTAMQPLGRSEFDDRPIVEIVI